MVLEKIKKSHLFYAEKITLTETLPANAHYIYIQKPNWKGGKQHMPISFCRLRRNNEKHDRECLKSENPILFYFSEEGIPLIGRPKQ